jgi:hypothetical protein
VHFGESATATATATSALSQPPPYVDADENPRDRHPRRAGVPRDPARLRQFSASRCFANAFANALQCFVSQSFTCIFPLRTGTKTYNAYHGICGRFWSSSLCGSPPPCMVVAAPSSPHDHHQQVFSLLRCGITGSVYNAGSRLPDHTTISFDGEGSNCEITMT